MTIEQTEHPHIAYNTELYNGEPVVNGTKTAVRHVVLLYRAGQDAEEIADNHRLTLAQVYDALSYYYDHEDEINHYIANEPYE